LTQLPWDHLETLTCFQHCGFEWSKIDIS
jgi:hypothetical protein